MSKAELIMKGLNMEEEKKVIIDDLRNALEFYADERFWQSIYSHGQQSKRVWVGPGQGPDMARKALERVEEEDDAGTEF